MVIAVKCLLPDESMKPEKNCYRRRMIVGFPLVTLSHRVEITRILVALSRIMSHQRGTLPCGTFVDMALARYVWKFLVSHQFCPPWTSTGSLLFLSASSTDISHQSQYFALPKLGTKWTNGSRAHLYVQHRLKPPRTTHGLRRLIAFALFDYPQLPSNP